MGRWCWVSAGGWWVGGGWVVVGGGVGVWGGYKYKHKYEHIKNT